MNLRRRLLPRCRTIAAAYVFAFGVGASFAEQIQFSKPAVEIAGPARADENLPEARAKSLRFGTPEVAPLALPQQPVIIRLQPRRENDEDDPLSSRDPRRFMDRSSRQNDPSSRQNSDRVE